MENADNLRVERLAVGEEPPYELLLLADPSKALVDSYLKRGYCYLAYIGDELIGEYLLMESEPGVMEIMNIAVSESYQGRGIGKRLLLHAIREAARLKASVLEIGTGNSSTYQLLFYQKCGFRLHRIDHDFFVRHYEEEIIENGIRCRDMIRLRMPLD
ncbi:GNAT family N-acetyltransferase [Paenibacillus sp. J5C_2022]|uniref:GNAT family N-acetyltransferase n=1 Tax=Paenibacillus sp. J5C2022 TaxID=2977129 RepID=UPI0021CF9689|nr:GNAT family N-acetyltransferase [Paenibacillus sp. J5C2022]MCU6707399.1 GNAT family N-acetyltransferase [Paenibacillus sp. J5C2022]